LSVFALSPRVFVKFVTGILNKRVYIKFLEQNKIIEENQAIKDTQNIPNGKVLNRLLVILVIWSIARKRGMCAAIDLENAFESMEIQSRLLGC